MALTIKQVCSIEHNALDLEAPINQVKISPIGEVEGVDGRQFSIDAKQVISAMQSYGLDIPLNIDHGDTARGNEAAGWFSNYVAKSDGIYADLEFLDDGKTLVGDRKYRYLSPEFMIDYESQIRGAVVTIVGVGLVNQPNLLNEALNNIEQEEAEMAAPEQADNDEELTQTKAENVALKARLDELETQARTSKVENAIDKGNLAPAKKDFALTLSENQLDSYLASEATTFKATEKNNITNNNDDEQKPTSEVFAQMGLTE